MLDARPKIKEAKLSLTVIRGNGTVEKLGVVSYYSKNPIKQWWYNLTHPKGGRIGYTRPK